MKLLSLKLAFNDGTSFSNVKGSLDASTKYCVGNTGRHSSFRLICLRVFEPETFS